MEQGKTIKEIAEELGVSKTAVRKQIANKSQTSNCKPVCEKAETSLRLKKSKKP